MIQDLNRELAHVGEMTDRLKKLGEAWRSGKAEEAVRTFNDTLDVLENWTKELGAEIE